MVLERRTVMVPLIDGLSDNDDNFASDPPGWIDKAHRHRGAQVTMPVVVVSAEELERLVASAVERALNTRALAANEPPPAEWIDTREAARILGVSSRQVAKLAAPARGASARLPSSRVGRLLRFRRADVLALLEGGTP